MAHGSWRPRFVVGAILGVLVVAGAAWLLTTNASEGDPGPAAGAATGADAAAVRERLLAELDRGLSRWYAGDPAGYADLYAEELSYFDPGTDVSLDGIEALRAFYAPLEGEISVDRYETADHRLQLHGDVAILTFLLNEYVGSDEPTTVWKVTHVYYRFGDDWRVVHGHFSMAGQDP